MSFDLSSVEKIFKKIKTAANGAELSDAKYSAKRFVRNLDDEQIEKLKEQGLEVYGDGEEFKDNLLQSFQEEINNNEAAKNSESIFTKSIDEISKMDLSQENIYKILNSDTVNDASQTQESSFEADLGQNNEGAENLETGELDENGQFVTDSQIQEQSQEQPQINENDMEFYKLLNAMYNDPVLKGVIDSDGDGEITNEEAQAFIQSINIDEDNQNFSLNDIVEFIDKANKDVVDDSVTEIQNQQNSYPQQTYQYQNPSSYQSSPASYSTSRSSGGGSSARSAQPQLTLPEKKEELISKINEYKNELSQINSLQDDEILSALNDSEAAKEYMNECINNDENISNEQKEQFSSYELQINEFDNQINDFDSQISSLNTDLTTGQNTLSSLKSALSSLAMPTGKEEDKDYDAKLIQRRAELESQIREQEEANKALQDNINTLTAQKEEIEAQKSEVEALKEELTNQILVGASDETKAAIEDYNNKKQLVEDIKERRLQEVNTQIQTAQDELSQVEQEILTKENAAAEAKNEFSADFDEMMERVFESEGGYSNHPNDRGGATNMGITTATYRAWTGDPNADVRNITREEAKQIYYENYFKASGADKYIENGNSAYAYALFDAAVNHGVGGAAKIDKQAQGDVDAFMELRKQKYINIVANDPSQAVFAKGWQNRWNSVYSYIDPTHEYENYIG